MNHNPLRRAMLACAVFAAWNSRAQGVGSSLDRRALRARRPSGAVLLSACLAGRRVVAVGERGLALVSDDNGRSWRQADVPVSVSLTAVRFADERRGYAAGHGGVVLRTSDGGETWTRILEGRAVGALMLEVARSTGDVAHERAARRLVDEGPDKPFLDLHVHSPDKLVVIGAYGLALESRDAGETWAPWGARLPNPKGSHLYAMRVSGSVVGIAGEQGLVLRSDDFGMSFRRIAVPYGGSFFALELLGSRGMLAAGLRGSVWWTSDAGFSWTACRTAVPATVTASSLRADGTLLLANQAGQLIAGEPDKLVPLKLPPMPPLNGVLPLPGGQLLALSNQGLRVLGVAQ